MTGLLIGSSKWIVLSSSLVIGFVATCIVLYLCNTLLARKEQAQ
jgi:lipopolysaccharide export LptBFGC system permease protein LptF